MRPNPHIERLRLLHPVRKHVAAALFFMGLTIAGQLAFPKAISYFVDNIDLLKAQGVPVGVALLALGLIVVHALATACKFYLFESAGLSIVTSIRRRLFDVMINQPIAWFDKHHVGELNSRLTSDVQALHQALTMGAANALSSACTLIGAIALLIYISPALTAVLALFIPASAYLGKLSGNDYRKRSRQLQATLADTGKVAHEYFSHVRLVQGFNQQDGASAKYLAATGRLVSVSLASVRMLAMFRGAGTLLGFASLLLTLWLGAYLIGQGSLSLGDLAAVVMYSSMVTAESSSLSEFWNTWMRAIGATDHVFDILRNAQPGKQSSSRQPLTGSIEFDKVSFRYPERPDVVALNEISLRAGAGEKLALVGASGAGKSTIASLILGHYPAGSGRVLFDGIEASCLGIEHVRRHIATVEQEPSLFSGTIAENIAFAVPEREVSLDEVKAAARLANAHDFISSFPDGYGTLVGERGLQLSGGQKQRVAIARAILRNPRILILDEATSALDANSEVQIQAALDTLMQGRTTIIIAHRFSTIVKADRIAVLEHGRIVQQGVHQQLVGDRDGIYYRLIQNQLLQADTLTQVERAA